MPDSNQHRGFDDLRAAISAVNAPLIEETIQRLEEQYAAQGTRLDAVRLERDTLEGQRDGLKEQLESERVARSEALNDMQVIIDLAQPNVERHTAFVHIARIARFYREAWENGSNPATDARVPPGRGRSEHSAPNPARYRCPACGRDREMGDGGTGRCPHCDTKDRPVSAPAFGPRIQNDSDPTRRVSGASPEGDDGDTGAETFSPASEPGLS